MRGEAPVSLLDQIENSDAPEEEEEEDDNDFVPFVRWKGTIDTRVDETSDVQRSGFCAIRSPEFPFGGADLGGRYNGMEFMVCSDGRPYSVNLKVESFIPEDLFQCFISITPTMEPGTEACPETGGKFD
jgi:hypothetical protein